MNTGYLIVLEGIDGSGTTTQSNQLVRSLQTQRIPCHLTREPSDGPVGRLLRQVLEQKLEAMNATTMSLLFAADRANHIEKEVEPALSRGEVVVSDRWYHSSLAYQGTVSEERKWILALNRKARRPDLTIFLRVRPETAAARRKAEKRSHELYDDLLVQKQVAAGYDATVAMLQSSEPIAILNGEDSADVVHKNILSLELISKIARSATCKEE